MQKKYFCTVKDDTITLVQKRAEFISGGKGGCEGCYLYENHYYSECPNELVSGAEGCKSKPIIWKLKAEEPAVTPKTETTVNAPTVNALTKQVGGGHYKEFGIQPVEYIHANNLSFLEGNVVKYITRHKSKNGIEDIKKVIHYCELIIELEYNQKKEPK